ncbi:MAG: hypothetical protein H6713_25530 [Myxococcales bacterium]|nr:hypothetical protein [Myxococcales bacterium]MCB9753316.1 hypothetical protein [Myxococcales bacterium]
MRSLQWGLALALVASACGDDQGDTASAGGDSETEASAGESASDSATESAGDSDSGGDASQGGDSAGQGEARCDKVDLLFVIDDSGSMEEEQDKLTAAFPDFMITADAELIKDKGVDYRVGVISVDMVGPSGQNLRGRLQHAADRLACDDVPPGRWIEAGPLGDVATQFKCVASMAGGAGLEMPLEALRASLTDRVHDAEAYNAGFLRDDALLVVMLITDEDDQSVLNVGEDWDGLVSPGPITPVPVYWDLLVKLKGGDPGKLVLIALSGAEAETCSSVDGVADPAPRVHELLELAAPNSHWGLICDDDYAAPLRAALDVIQASCDGFGD